MTGCNCYKCVGTEWGYDDKGRRFVANNMEYHTLGEPCKTCGRQKSEYKDLGRKGRYVCWWCHDRAAGPFGPEAAPPSPLVADGGTAEFDCEYCGDTGEVVMSREPEETRECPHCT